MCCIWTTSTNKNYRFGMEVMKLFNNLITGNGERRLRTKNHFTTLYFIIKNLLKDNVITGMDGFMSSTIRAFVNDTKNIDLDLLRIDSAMKWEKKELQIHPISLLFYDMKKRPTEKYTNLFRMELLQIFKNVQRMNIWTRHFHSICFDSLLELLRSSGLRTVVIKSSCKSKNKTWAERAWEMNYNVWTEEYAKEKYKVTSKLIQRRIGKQVHHIIEKQD